VVTNGPSDAHLWNVDREGVAERLIGSPSPTVHVDVSAVGPWAVAASQDGKLRLWNLDSLDQAPRLLPPNDGPATSARFSPDGRSVLVRFANATRVQLLATDGVRRTMVLPHDAIVDTALWSANGQQIITTSRGIVRIWNANGITEVADLKGHAGEVRGLAFSPDSRRLASAGASGTIRLWDAQTFTLRDSLTLPDSLTRRDSLAARGAVARRASAAIQTELHDVAFAPDGASLAVVASTGAVGIYATPGSRWLTVWLAVRHAWPIALALVFLPIPWLIYRLLLRRRATAFIRRQTNERPQIEHIRLRTLDDGLFPERSVMRIASRLRRRIDMPSPELDVTASVTQTLRHGGVFTPAFRRLKVTPEYLALVDRATLRDQQTAFVDELLDRLRSDQVLITRYYFDGDPRVCFPADPSGHPVTLGTLTQQYESHRILLFADARRCFNPVTGEMARWTDLVRRWPVRALLTPEVPARWGSTEGTVAREMAVYHASVAGLTDLADEARSAMPNAEAEESAGRFPPALLRRPGRWIERAAVPPAEVQEMLAQVRAYLGDDGITWLAACAVYPAMSWKLTLNLGHELHASDGGSLLDADRLLRLSRLPWFRHGYIPDWLRLTLLDLLTSEQEAQVRRTLELLLLTAVAGDDDSFDLEVANRHKQTIHALAGPVMRRLRRKSPPSAPLRDYVFAEFMSGHHRERLAVKVARVVPVLGASRAKAGGASHSPARRESWSRSIAVALVALMVAVRLVSPAARAAEAAWLRVPQTPLAVGRTPRVLNPAPPKPNSSPSPAVASAATRDSSQRPVDEGSVRELGPTPDSGATPFRDMCDAPDEIRVRAGWWMNSIQLVCRTAPPQRFVVRPRRGGDGGADSVFRLAAGERITAVSGSYDGEYGQFLFSLQFHTNQRSSPVYGNGGPAKGRTPFRFEIPAGGRFAGFSGRSGEARSSDGNLGDYLVSLGVLYVGPPPAVQGSSGDSSRTPRMSLPTAPVPLRILSIYPGNGFASVSIDASVRLDFGQFAPGDSIDLTTVTPDRIRLSGGGRVISWRASVDSRSVMLVPTTPLTEFKTPYTVSISPGIASVQGRQLTQPDTSSFTTVLLDSLYYYRITNAFLGPRHSLNANPTCAMQVASSGDAGDWFFTPIPKSDGYYFMHNAVRGTTGVLEGAAPPDPCFIMDFAGTVFGGIMWRPVPTPERSVFTLENANFKSPRSLTVSREDGRTTTMQPTSVDAAQLWRFSRARRR
jgi:hypothetical protein